MVLLSHICGDLPAQARMLGRRGHRSLRFCLRCNLDYDKFPDNVEDHHRTHEDFIKDADEVHALVDQLRWTTNRAAAAQQLLRARQTTGINLRISLFQHLPYVNLMHTVHVPIMHCILYGVLKSVLDMALGGVGLSSLSVEVAARYRITCTVMLTWHPDHITTKHAHS